MNKKGRCPRLAAAHCLVSVVAEGNSLSRVVGLFEKDLPAEQRSLYRELCYGTLRQFWRLDAALTPSFKKPLKNKDLDIKMLVMIGAYQLFYTRIPPHASINSVVDACKALKKNWATGMVNAILRNAQRQGDAFFEGLAPAAQSGFPEWLFDAISQAWPTEANAIFDASNSHPPFCLRVNRLHHSRDHYLDLLAEQQIEANACDFAKQGIRLEHAIPAFQLPGFESGWVSVQDEAAQLCCELLDLQAGQRVLDACAAPGGKTGAILESQSDLSELIAIELEPRRLERIEENLERLQLHASVICADAADTESWWDGGAFDRILLDAPCSATGVIRRNPDIRLHRKADDIAELSKLQLRLLNSLWPTLKPGGLLVYATCSILPQENEAVVQAFTEQTEDASVQTIQAEFGTDRTGTRQLFPQIEGHDGFFYAVLKKSA
ncbi:16S rRNA (cytosine(967)-C(5))-methyltransferase RsmB [Spongiibacter sp. KMU-158]|uniref:16S rRNA (cytosine(967)-C(5))-methyltransferase n=1 Tax=Spongiibacter pelagi TaxID=2760804 RepID=A0A927C044_9GAMM|nr:16S rRNA (cytosine(967)-C(5))-methyltransferase RsmB [Spongiibacter pelagi]MBD2857587.1 16S rRNA (cytosine(967)-C(5))-methyltransferase RsmB [Spongiibacter pelagi]